MECEKDPLFVIHQLIEYANYIKFPNYARNSKCNGNIQSRLPCPVHQNSIHYADFQSLPIVLIPN